MLEVKGELVFKTSPTTAPRTRSRAVPFDVAAAYRAGDPPKIPGVGAAIDAKIAELATTGRMGFYERLREEVPPALVELLRVPGRRAPDRARAVRDARHREPRGPPPRGRGRPPARRCAASRSGPRRRSWRASRRSSRSRGGCCWARAASIVDVGHGRACAPSTGVTRLEAAGSFRRRRETIGDLDILAETSAPGALIDRFVDLGARRSGA